MFQWPSSCFLSRLHEHYVCDHGEGGAAHDVVDAAGLVDSVVNPDLMTGSGSRSEI